MKDFVIIGEITRVEPIARGLGVRDRRRLDRVYANGRRMRWLKKKGFTEVRYNNGEVWYVEVHWYEAHGVGRLEEKVTDRIRRLA